MRQRKTTGTRVKYLKVIRNRIPHLEIALDNFQYGDGYIYILKIDNWFKIGKTTQDVRSRILSAWHKAKRTRDFDIVSCVPVEMKPGEDCNSPRFNHSVHDAEFELHQLFKSKRDGRFERFFLTDNDIAYIKSIKEYRDGEFIFT